MLAILDYHKRKERSPLNGSQFLHSTEELAKKVAYISKIYYYGTDCTLSDRSVAPTTEIHTAAMLILLTGGK
jgi:hypothetical protein